MIACFECGAFAEYNHHVVPRSLGGTNTVQLCGMCHAKVHGHNKPMTSRALTIVALARKRANGEKTGGDVPFGYRVKGGRLYADEGEQEAIAMILDLRTKGETLRAICRALESAGIPRKGGTESWSPVAVLRIIRRHERGHI